MNYRHRFTTSTAKIVGSLMTIAFSLVAFAYGQSCNLLPGWSPSTLADGQSRTGYQINEATYTQSCDAAAGTITCTNWVLNNGNTFKFASCIPHVRNNCTTPLTGNHLEYKTLYKASQATYTQSCQQLSQSLQCLNGIFTWGITPNLFTFGSCVDPTWAQCIDTRTSSYRDHGETITAYISLNPSPGQTCTTLQKTLTCYNGTRSGNGTQQQAGLFTGCTDPNTFAWCTNIRTNTLVPHGSSLNAYTSPVGNCTAILQPLTCINGLRSWGNQSSLFSGCTQANTNPCSLAAIGLWIGTRSHGSFVTEYTNPVAFQAAGSYCSDYAKTLQCTNGVRSGYTPGLYTGCQNVQPWSCLDSATNIYTPLFQTVVKYTIGTATTTQSCASSQQVFTCSTGGRAGWLDPSSYNFPTCGGCILPRGGTVPEWWNGFWYSATWALFPNTCNNLSAALSCSWGILNGNWQTYAYASCIWIGALVPGVDITIDESPGLPGASNVNGNLIAQWSSPGIDILFRNKWDTAVNTVLPPGFLSCTRKEQNINIYNSNAITNFALNPGTSMGVNISINPLFTQALWTKTIVCKINPGSIADVNPSNNIWSWAFEVVTADRFDLALSTSIQGIQKNLETPEGAKGTQGLTNFLFDKIMNVLVPLIIVIGILSAILWFYKIMFSTDDSATKEWSRYIIYGVIGIIVIMSAKFIGQNVYDLLNPATGQIQWNILAVGLYNNIVYPFVKFAIYLVLGAMFVILVSRVITFLFGTDADAQKKAWTLIGWNVISMIVIIWAKQIVEAIYGKQAAVTSPNATNLGTIWSWILADKNIPIIYQIINYALGIASLVILVIIIVQTVKLLTKPDDPAQIKSIKNSLLYMFIGILVIGTGYLIVNFAILN